MTTEEFAKLKVGDRVRFMYIKAGAAPCHRIGDRTGILGTCKGCLVLWNQGRATVKKILRDNVVTHEAKFGCRTRYKALEFLGPKREWKEI
jgi:hypothetical protein